MLITLTGGAGSGKTTLAAALTATVLHGDDYYFGSPAEGGIWSHDPDGSGPWIDVGDPASVDFARLNEDTAAALGTGRVVVVEGMFARMVAVECRRLDVFVDLAADLRLARKIERKCVRGGFPLEVLLRNYPRRRAQHEQHVEPLRAACGLVVDGGASVEVTAKSVRDAASA
ncbi:hypothetical protein [Phytomonospora endophytica]|uniref:Uridine kinase n=1 Tax=Phytomonospora endophytica TaxID=714109 RepID=A0A841F7U8_9ACTN|nr:hypothetical protein [Phytomonospora endophytica]MBB6033121.1 uridine kinase [Phytomonospora endophytica]GIG65347.1 hypothetical protein Pen01_16420 [Phytomonospora endophytica]